VGTPSFLNALRPRICRPSWWLEGLVSKIRGGRGSGLVRRTTARVMLMDCRLPARRSRFRRKCPGVGSVSRKIIEASESEVKELLSRRFDEMRLVLVVSSRDAAFDGISKRRRSEISSRVLLDRLIPKSPGAGASGSAEARTRHTRSGSRGNRANSCNEHETAPVKPSDAARDLCRDFRSERIC
jgi:hypothetical protein